MSDDLVGFEDLFSPDLSHLSASEALREIFKRRGLEPNEELFAEWQQWEDELLYGTGKREPLGILNTPSEVVPFKPYTYQLEAVRTIMGYDPAPGPDKTAWVDCAGFNELQLVETATGKVLASEAGKLEEIDADALLKRAEEKLREAQPNYRPWRPFSEPLWLETYEYIMRHNPKPPKSPIILARR